MTKRRRILHADRIIRNVINLFCLLMFLQLKGYYSISSNPVLLYSTASDIRIVNTSRLSQVNTIMKDLDQGSAVDFLYSKSLICWSDQTAELIQCMKYNDTYVGDTMRIVSEGLTTPTGIAIDWYTEKIYWTDGETNRIEVISIQEKYRKVLFWTDVDLARAIAVVPSKGLLFWTDWGEIPKIERAGMNGDPATRTIIVKENIFWPNGITVDYDNEIIYWVDAKLHFVDSMDYNGGNRKRIVKTGLVYPYALTVTEDKLFWTDWKKWAIYMWDMATHGPIKDLMESHPVPVDIKVFNGSRQVIPDGDYPCKQNNGMCSHLCLLSPIEPGYTCACPTGVKLRENSTTTCYNRPQSMLIVAQRSSISKISLDSPDFTPYTLPLKDLKRALTVDFDPVTEYIYWADNLAKSISRARLDGSGQAVVVAGGVPDSLALDPLARALYWTDPAADTISVASLRGSYTKVLVYSELYEPRAIALHPAAGLMFWSDWNEKRPKIERASLDGGARVTLVAERLAWPNALALDGAAGRLYWADARTRRLEACGLDGSARRELLAADLLHVFGLALLDDRLYWTDMQKRTLDRIDKRTGADRQPVVEQMANMMGLKALRLGAAPGHSRCAPHNGGCSHFCFNRPHDYVCGCPLELELSNDTKTCVKPKLFLVYSRKNTIGRISLEQPNNTLALPIKELKEVSAIALDVSASKIYWADSKLKTINRCSLDGTGAERIVEGVGPVEGLAVDWRGGNLYWTDAGAGRVSVARLDGAGARGAACALRRPRGLALLRGEPLWAEARGLRRAGGGRAGAARASALAAAAACWATLEPPALACDAAPALALPPAAVPAALDRHADQLYWADWNTGVVEAVPLDGSARRVVATGLDYVSGLRVWAKEDDPEETPQCSVDNGGCEHLCLSSGSSQPAFHCACPTHYRLNPDNVTCAEPEDYLLYATRHALGRVMAAPGECGDERVPAAARAFRAIEYDPVDRQLYWIEEETLALRRAPLAGAGELAAGAGELLAPRAAYMALDPLGRALYWSADDALNVTALGEPARGTLLRAPAARPRQLAFDPLRRCLVWVDAARGAIMRGGPDARGAAVLARAANVSALALDDGTVYWAAGRQLHAVHLDSQHRRVVWQGGAVSCAAVYGGAAYLCGERALLRVPLRRRDAPAAPLAHLARVVALARVQPVPAAHPCRRGGACGVAACGAGGACGCGLRCAAPRRCDHNHFLCDADNCIPDHWKCDGQRDCADGSDEAWCGSCGGGLRCADGRCGAALPACAAGARCPLDRDPPPNAFRCDTDLCLSPALVCDGRAQCADGADERSCGGAAAAPAPGPRRGGALAVCGGVGGALAACGAAAAALRRWRRGRARPAPPAALPLCAPPPSPPAAAARWRPTPNPPPSPATASEAPRRRPYRHYRAINRPPPPTPASTDACESEPEPPARAPPPSPAPHSPHTVPSYTN